LDSTGTTADAEDADSQLRCRFSAIMMMMLFFEF